MTLQEITTSARAIVAEHLKVPLAKVTEGATFDSLGADSLDHIEIAFDLETHFDISIPDDAADAIPTVGQAVDYLVKRVGVVEA